MPSHGHRIRGERCETLAPGIPRGHTPPTKTQPHRLHAVGPTALSPVPFVGCAVGDPNALRVSGRAVQKRRQEQSETHDEAHRVVSWDLFREASVRLCFDGHGSIRAGGPGSA